MHGKHAIVKYPSTPGVADACWTIAYPNPALNREQIEALEDILAAILVEHLRAKNEQKIIDTGNDKKI